MDEFESSLLSAGDDLGRRYVINKLLYQTVDGDYYLAEDQVLKQAVCLKVLSLEQMQDSAVLARIQQEARIMVRCEHAAFQKMSNFGITDDGRAFLASEFTDGIRLDSFLIGRAPLQFEEAFPLIAQLCDALDYAHSIGVLLRELKPESIFLFAEEGGLSIKLTNLSAAVFKADADDELSSGARSTILNKNGCFSSPEFLLAKNIDERSDLFSLGCICYFMLCGSAPFSNGEIKNSHRMHEFLKPKKLKNLLASSSLLTLAAEPLIRKTLEIYPGDRFAGAREFLDELIFMAGRQSVAALDSMEKILQIAKQMQEQKNECDF